MKKIAFYCCDFYPNQSGYSHAFQSLIIGLTKVDDDCEVDVFTPVPLRGHKELALNRVRIIRKTIPFLWASTYIGSRIHNLFVRPYILAKAIVKNDHLFGYSYIVFESIDDPLVLCFLPKNILAKLIVRIHATAETEYAFWGTDCYQLARKVIIRHHLRRNIKYIASTSDYYINFVKKWYLNGNQLLSAEKRFCVIPNAAPAYENIVNSTSRRSFGRSRHFFTLGRMNVMGANQKGFEDIIGSLMLLPQSERRFIKLTIVGAGSERGRLINLSRKVSDVEFNFIESMPNDKVKDGILTADCVILASRYEGLSIFALEALAFGAPVIFSNVGGLKSLVENNGIAFESGNINTLAKAISYVVNSSSTELETMSKRSLEIAKRYAPETIGQALKGFSSIVGID